MKEGMIPSYSEGARPVDSGRASGSVELTRVSIPHTLVKGEILLMDGQGEVPKITPEPVIPAEPTAVLAIARDSQAAVAEAATGERGGVVQSPEDFVQYLATSEQFLRDNPTIDPFEKFDNDQLQNAYIDGIRMLSEARLKGIDLPRGFSLGPLMLAEMKRRDIDTESVLGLAAEAEGAVLIGRSTDDALREFAREGTPDKAAKAFEERRKEASMPDYKASAAPAREGLSAGIPQDVLDALPEDLRLDYELYSTTSQAGATEIADAMSRIRELNVKLSLKDADGNPVLTGVEKDAVERLRNQIRDNIIGQTDRIADERLRETQRQLRLILGSDFREIGGIYLQKEDEDLLTQENGHELWLENVFDGLAINYRGQDINSNLIQQAQGKLPYVQAWIRNESRKRNIPPERATQIVADFTSEFQIRLNGLFLRLSIERRNKETVGNLAPAFGASGLAASMRYESGTVGPMFHRVTEALEDMRLREGGLENHLDPEMMWKIQQKIIDEQLPQALADEGKGIFGEAYKRAVSQPVRELDENGNVQYDARGKPRTRDANPAEVQDRMRLQVIRSVRTAYDVFAESQRYGILAARGYHRLGRAAGKSDPQGVFDVWNWELFLVRKWNILNAHAREWLNYSYRFIAKMHVRREERKYEKFQKELRENNMASGPAEEGIKRHLEKLKAMSFVRQERVGKILFENPYLPDDFYSSGWRSGEMVDQLGKLFEYKVVTRGMTDEERKNKDLVEQRIHDITDEQRTEAREAAAKFGLFLRVNQASDDHDRREAWNSASQYRQDEIVRLFRERTSGQERNDPHSGKENPLAKEDNDFVTWANTTFSNIPVDGRPADRKFGSNREADIAEQAKYRFDKFREIYGPAMRAIREEAMRQDIPEQIDFSFSKLHDPNISQAERDRLTEQREWVMRRVNEVLKTQFQVMPDRNPDKALRGTVNATELIRIFGQMNNYIHGNVTQAERQQYNTALATLRTATEHKDEAMHNHHPRHADEIQKQRVKPAELRVAVLELTTMSEDKIHTLLTDPRFLDVYRQALVVDDILLDQLEEVPEGSGMIPLSRIWSGPESGGDAFKRSYGDIINTSGVLQEFMGWVNAHSQEQKIEHAIKAADTASIQNGPNAKARMVFQTAGPVLVSSKLPTGLEVIGIRKGLFEKAITIYEKIHGPASKGLASDEILHHLHETIANWTKHMINESINIEYMTPDEVQHLRHESHENSMEEVNYIMEQAGVTPKDRIKKGLIAFLLALMIGAIDAGKETLEEGAEELKAP